MQEFDLVIIGSGSGNSVLTEEFAGWRAAIVDHGSGPRGSFGGTCLNVGCIPSKMLFHTAEVAAAVADAGRFGLTASLDGADWPAIRDRVFGRIDPIADRGGDHRRSDSANTALFEGTARFIGERTLEVVTEDGIEQLRGGQVVVAAGSRPVVPDIQGIDEVPFHTSDTVMRIDRLPESMTIVGAGLVAAESAFVFSALGVAVTVVARGGRMLRGEDEDVSRRFTELAARQWRFIDYRIPVAVRHTEGRIELELSGGETIRSEALLLATGRRSNADLVDAAAGGLGLDAAGRIVVDDHQRTTAPGVWALGDVSSRFQLKHKANADARVVWHNLLHPTDLISTDDRFVPHAVFSHPQIAAVGLTEQRARAEGIAYVAAVQDYADVAYGWAMEETTGFLKVLADPATGRLLGAHVIGPQASTVIQPLVMAMSLGIDAATMARGQYWIHPALPELIENALLDLELD